MRALITVTLVLTLCACPGGGSRPGGANGASGGGGGGGGKRDLLAEADERFGAAEEARMNWEVERTDAARATYIAAYREAADLYARHLKGRKDAPIELRLRHAGALLFAEDFAAAAAAFRAARDAGAPGSPRYEEAARGVVAAAEKAVNAGIDAGTLTEPPVPRGEALRGKPIPIPAPYQELIRACDEYVDKGSDDQRKPRVALAAAMVAYRHLQLDEALRRYRDAATRWCERVESVEAKDAALAILLARGDDAGFRELNNRFVGAGCGGGKQAAAGAAAGTQNLAAVYESAMRLYKEGKVGPAAEKMRELAHLAPSSDANRDDAFWSAGFMFEKAGRLDDALAIYQEFVALPEASASELYPEALLRVAALLDKRGDGAGAAAAYVKLAGVLDEKGRKTRPELDVAATRSQALWNAAVLREQAGFFADRGKDPGAATLFGRFAAVEKDAHRAAEAGLRAAVATGKGGDLKRMASLLGAWRKRYGAEKQLTVLSFVEEGRLLDAAGKPAQAAYEGALRVYADAGERPGSASATLAAEAQFWLAERACRQKLDPFTVTWRGQKDVTAEVQAAIDAVGALVRETQAGYQKVLELKSSWSLAAAVRMADAAYAGARKLRDAPMPPAIVEAAKGDPAVATSYREQIQDVTAPLVASAREMWGKVAAEGKKQRSEWTEKAEARLKESEPK
jgi:hypothetical protein